jgi:hypothetical protein
MTAPKTILINGKRIAWTEVMRLRKEQLAAAKRHAQPALFKLRDDSRPPTQKHAAGRSPT